MWCATSKLADLEHRTAPATLISDRVPDLDADDALTLTRHAVVSLVGLWPSGNPTPTIVEATADPRLAGSLWTSPP
jgi:Tetracyclin repressor-like, C-terminal domain